MNIRDDIRQLKTGPGELRKFGVVVGGVFAAIGALLLWRNRILGPYFFWGGAGLLVCGLVLPRAIKWIYIAWMSAAFIMGFIVSHVLLVLLFLLVITPTGLLARLCGQDFLKLKLDRTARSYWMPRVRKPKSAADHERQF